jgi:hypothetical protein
MRKSVKNHTSKPDAFAALVGGVFDCSICGAAAASSSFGCAAAIAGQRSSVPLLIY